MRLRPPGKESSNEKAETENRIAVWTGVHDLLLYGTDNVLVDFVGKIACLPMRLLESDRLLAVRALCHMASWGKGWSEISGGQKIARTAASRDASRNETTAPESA